MIEVTPYNLDCQEVTGVVVETSAQTMEEAAKQIGQKIIITSKYWVLCGDGDQRYLITKKEAPTGKGLTKGDRVVGTKNENKEKMKTKQPADRLRFIEQLNLDLI